jgi:hypothetical protein
MIRSMNRAPVTRCGRRTSRTRCGLTALCLLVSGISPAKAQSTAAPQDPPLEAGARIRVKQSAAWANVPTGTTRIGTLRALTRDSLTVAWPGGRATTLPLSTVARLEASQGKQHYVGRGLLIGLLAGAGAGAIIGAASYDETACGENACFIDFGRGFYALAGTAVGGGIGLVAGGIVGATGRREVWRRVRLDAIASRVSVLPLPAARGIAVRWSLGR